MFEFPKKIKNKRKVSLKRETKAYNFVLLFKNGNYMEYCLTKKQLKNVINLMQEKPTKVISYNKLYEI